MILGKYTEYLLKNVYKNQLLLLAFSLFFVYNMVKLGGSRHLTRIFFAYRRQFLWNSY